MCYESFLAASAWGPWRLGDLSLIKSRVSCCSVSFPLVSRRGMRLHVDTNLIIPRIYLKSGGQQNFNFPNPDVSMYEMSPLFTSYSCSVKNKNHLEFI